MFVFFQAVRGDVATYFIFNCAFVIVPPTKLSHTNQNLTQILVFLLFYIKN